MDSRQSGQSPTTVHRPPSGSAAPSTDHRPPSGSAAPSPDLRSSHLRSSVSHLPSGAPAFAALSHLPIPDLSSLPGRWRIFEKGGAEMPVVFWHLLEDELYQYGNQSAWKRLKRLVMDPFERGLDTRKEQWLVRVTL